MCVADASTLAVARASGQVELLDPPTGDSLAAVPGVALEGGQDVVCYAGWPWEATSEPGRSGLEGVEQLSNGAGALHLCESLGCMSCGTSWDCCQACTVC